MSAPGRALRSEPLAMLTLEGYLELLSARSSVPASGSAAGVSAALAAALCGMAARFSNGSLDSAGEIAAKADRLRLRALQLAEADSVAYTALLEARRLPKDTVPDEREEAMAAAAAQVVAIPLEIAEIGAEIGLLASKVASDGNPNLLGDALGAMLLAEAAAAVASTIAEINVAERSQAVVPPRSPTGTR
ncbi:MAG: cyclodeaminase/cyclohydrolase family protein [Actinomycetota bacterium]|nr:cyclodeaminase/cyclohydrolase family protein [Actinomycetota bacterium]